MRGRGQDGRRRWSASAIEREIAFALARPHDPYALRPVADWDEPGSLPFPTLRRLQITTPVLALSIAEVLGRRPGARYIEAIVDDLRFPGLNVVTLDPGGDLSDWHQLVWFNKATGQPWRVSTDSYDWDAIHLETLDDRARRWSDPPRTAPIEKVTINRQLVRRVGRVSGVIDAYADGLPGELAARRPVYDGDQRVEVVIASARSMGPRRFARVTGLPLGVAHRASKGLPISTINVNRALAVFRTGSEQIRTCAAEGCDRRVARENALCCSIRCADRERKRRIRASASRRL